MSRDEEIKASSIKRLQTLPGVSIVVAAALFEAGLRTPQHVRRASDAELLEVPGIGAETLKTLRQPPSPQAVQKKVGRRTIDWDPVIGGPVLKTDPTAPVTLGTPVTDAAPPAVTDTVSDESADGSQSGEISSTQSIGMAEVPAEVQAETAPEPTRSSGKKAKSTS